MIDHSTPYYSRADIERYLNGQMDPAEMHTLEKAALQDPFLAEAIEGYSHATSEESVRNLETIRTAILGRKEETKVIPMMRSKRWWGIAASAAVFLLAGLVWWISFRPATQRAVAVVPAPHTVTGDSIIFARPGARTNRPARQADIVSAEGRRSVRPGSPAHKQYLTATAMTASPEIHKDTLMYVAAVPPASGSTLGSTMTYNSTAANDRASLRQEKIDTTPTEIMISSLADKKMNALKEADGSAKRQILSQHLEGKASDAMVLGSQSGRMITGSVLNMYRQPVPNAVIRRPDGEVLAETDSRGFFRYSTDTVLTVKVNSSAYAPVTKTLHETDNTILLSPEASLSETVVSSLAKRNSMSSAINYSGKTGAIPLPEGGWKNFRNYLSRELGARADSASSHGTLKFSAAFDGSGKPGKIIILQSPYPISNKKLIRVIRRGPRWTARTTQKTVTVQL